MADARFEIEPRPGHLGGGYRLRLIDDDGEEAGGGVFPPADDSKEADLDAYAEAHDEGSAWLAHKYPTTPTGAPQKARKPSGGPKP